MPQIDDTCIQSVQYADLLTCIEGDQTESYEQSISFVVTIGQNPAQVINVPVNIGKAVTLYA